MHNLFALQNNYNVLQMHLKILTKGWKMNKDNIKTLLKEFDYDKNDFDTTLEFLAFITNQMIEIKEKEGSKNE